MKRIISIVIAVLLLTGTAYAALHAEPVTYPVLVNGEAMTFTEAGGLPVNVNGRTYLPVRAVAEALGVPIAWKNNRVEIETIDLERLKDSCVMVYAGKDGKYISQGSGVIIDYDEVLTAYHVVDEECDTFLIAYDDNVKAHPCTLADSAPSADAAILTPGNKTIKPVPIGDSDIVKEGDTVWIVSSPQGEKNTVASGKVKGFGIIDNPRTDIFITTAAVDGGSSGGACFNAKGELIGLVDGQNPYDKTTNIIPINSIRKALAAS